MSTSVQQQRHLYVARRSSVTFGKPTFWNPNFEWSFSVATFGAYRFPNRKATVVECVDLYGEYFLKKKQGIYKFF